MFLIVIALSFFLGILSLFAEKQHLSRNVQTMTHHAQSLRNTCNTASEYEQQLRTFLESNAFALTQSKQGLCAERKIFSPGLFLLGIACGILGALLYVLYFSFFAKARQIPLPPFESTQRTPDDCTL